MAMTAPVERVIFSCPVIAPRHYITKGPSGWPETFERTKLDAELEVFVRPIAPRELAELFINLRATADKQETIGWFTIVGFLGRTIGISPNAVPATVGIAFWAHVEILRREQAVN